MLTAERLRYALDYDALTGDFIWRVSLSNRVKANAIAGSISHDGRRIISLDGRRYYGHRLAWFYVTGQWPPALIDHIDGNPGNNRFSNLRLASCVENCRNQKLKRRNALGKKGVSRHRTTGRYRAKIMVSGKTIHLGYFTSADAAHAAYMAAANRLFGEFARAI